MSTTRPTIDPSSDGYTMFVKMVEKKGCKERLEEVDECKHKHNGNWAVCQKELDMFNKCMRGNVQQSINK